VEAGAVEEFDDELVDTGEGGDDRFDFLSGQDGRQPFGPPGANRSDGAGVPAQHFSVQEQQSGEGLFLGRRSDVPF
jgi:hypothetical protein